jgi:hypothetical protein
MHYISSNVIFALQRPPPPLAAGFTFPSLDGGGKPSIFSANRDKAPTCIER